MPQVTPVLQLCYAQKLTTMIDPVWFHDLHCFVSTNRNKQGTRSGMSIYDHYV